MKFYIPSTFYFLPCVLIVLLFLSFFFSVGQALAQCKCQCTPSGIVYNSGALGAMRPEIIDRDSCQAACAQLSPSGAMDSTSECASIPAAVGAVSSTLGETPLKDPLQGMDPITLAGKVINYALGLLGAGVFVVFLIGGGRILFSAGNPKMVEGGKKTLVYAVIGLAVIFLSYAVLNFFFTILQKGAG